MKNIMLLAFIALCINAIGQEKIEVYSNKSLIDLREETSLGQEKIVVYSDKSLIDLREEISLKRQFLDSLFYQGKVHFINGKTSSALMDYNLLDNGISFVDKDKNVLLLDGLEDISFITYNKRTFVPYQGFLLEQIESYTGDIQLLLKRKTTVKSNSVSGAYGMNSESSSVRNLSSLNGSSVSGSYTNLNKETMVDVTLESDYFLKINGRFIPISRLKALKKQFPDKKDSIISFISSNHLNISKLNDLKILIKYCIEDIH